MEIENVNPKENLQPSMARCNSLPLDLNISQYCKVEPQKDNLQEKVPKVNRVKPVVHTQHYQISSVKRNQGLLAKSINNKSEPSDLESVESFRSTEPNYRIALYFSLLSMIVGLLTLPFGWVMPNKFELFLLIFTGLVGSVANILLTVSLRYAEASLVTPTKYLNLVFAILLGYFIWSEIPKLLTLVGAGLIIISSVIIFMRESELKKKVVSSRP